MGRSWICFVDGSKTIHFVTVCTSYRWTGTIGVCLYG
ncbi:hypothetical protein Gotur_035731 [Gossypium turneri]